MAINYFLPDNRKCYPINGRYICFTSSRTLEYLELNKRFSYPLPSPTTSGYSIKSTDGFSFIIEARGFLLLDPDCEFGIVETDEYQRFNFQLTASDPYCAYTPYASLNHLISAVHVTINSVEAMQCLFNRPTNYTQLDGFTYIVPNNADYSQSNFIGKAFDSLPGSYSFQLPAQPFTIVFL